MSKYAIGEKTYVQKPLVMGQIEQLIDELKDIKIPNTRSPSVLKDAIGEKIYICISIAIVEEGKSPKRDLEEIRKIADEIRWSITPIQILEVIGDFFDCNPVASILERLRELKIKMEKIGIIFRFTKKGVQTGSEKPSPFSPEETSQREMPSSGDSHPGNVSPISGIESET